MRYKFAFALVVVAGVLAFISHADKEKKAQEWARAQVQQHRAEDWRRALQVAGKEMRVVKVVKPLDPDDDLTPWVVTWKTKQGTARTWTLHTEDVLPFLIFSWLPEGFVATVELMDESTTVLTDDPAQYEDRSYRYLVVTAIKDEKGNEVDPDLAIDQYNAYQEQLYRQECDERARRQAEWRSSPANPDNNLLLQYSNPANPISPFNPMNQPTYSANR